MHPTIQHTSYHIVTFKNPVQWNVDGDETWLLNPARRYVINADMITPDLASHVDTMSEFANSNKYKPLRRGENIMGKRVLVDRYRHRGIGDLLFMTGPMAWLRQITGNNVTLDVYALAERGAVYADNPHISNRSPLCGPILYDDLDNYAAHWFVDAATEFDESPDQLNVYDALYRTMDVDPATVDDRFKRPVVSLNQADTRALDAFYWRTFQDSRVDLRSTPYYVLAPLSHATLRTLPYSVWLEVADKLSQKYPVLVIGAPQEGRTPVAGMALSQFTAALGQLRGAGRPIVDCIGSTPLRLSMAIVAQARALGCLDSGMLYVAQAFRTPAVSVWGTHDPRVRLGYDKQYMDSAVFRKEQCPNAPCFAYSRFPHHKCPGGESQSMCEVLRVTASDILDKFAAL